MNQYKLITFYRANDGFKGANLIMEIPSHMHVNMLKRRTNLFGVTYYKRFSAHTGRPMKIKG